MEFQILEFFLNHLEHSDNCMNLKFRQNIPYLEKSDDMSLPNIFLVEKTDNELDGFTALKNKNI